MEWISGFKHEREILLYNQYLPIQKSETFDDDAQVLLNHFMYSLKTRAQSIVEKEAFYKQLGVRFDTQWIPDILKHRLLYEQSGCNNMRVMDRLKDELRIVFFQLYDEIDDLLVIDDDDMLVLRDVAKLKNVQVSECVFAAGLGSKVFTNWEDDDIIFNDITDFAIPCGLIADPNVESLNLNLFLKTEDETFKFVPIRKNMILPRYTLQRDEPFAITESAKIPSFDVGLRQRGTLCIRCTSDIVVEPDVVINGNEVSEDSNGGDIRLIARGSITNHGVICCNGSNRSNGAHGGDIYIVCDSFVNEGTLECIPDGNVFIFVNREYSNTGTVSANLSVCKTANFGRVDTHSIPGPLPVVVDYILSLMQSTSHRIEDPAAFYREIGISVDSDLIQSMLDHGQLFAESKFEKKKIIHRLSGELGLEIFEIYHILNGAIMLDDAMTLVLKHDALGKRTDHDDSKDDLEDDIITKYAFAITLGQGEPTPKSKTFRFDKLCDFAIPVRSVLDQEASSLGIQVHCKSLDNSFDFIRIDTLLLSRYIFESNTPLHITQSVRVSAYDPKMDRGGSLEVKSAAGIVIEGYVTISASETMKMTKEDCTVFNDKYKTIPPDIRRKQRKLFVKELGAKTRYTVGAAGGIIDLNSSGDIINHGTLCSHASDDGQYRGGDISIGANAFVNSGIIECSPGGTIKVSCNEYRDSGVISPAPLITIGTITFSNTLNETEKWSEFERLIPMEIYDHSGCSRILNHPKNLLVDDRSYYESRRRPLPEAIDCGRNWIIFKQNNTMMMKPSFIDIRNYYKSGGYLGIERSSSSTEFTEQNDSIKSMAMWIGKDDGKWTKLCDDIHGIPSKSDLQRINLSVTISAEDCLVEKGDLILVHFLETHDNRDRVRFYSMRFFGFPQLTGSLQYQSQDTCQTAIEWLRSIPNRIENPEAFYREFGIRVDADWVQSMMDHEELCAETEYEENRVIDRLIDELDLEIFNLCHNLRGNIVLNDDMTLVLNKEMDEGINDMISKYTFTVMLDGGDLSDKTTLFRFREVDDFALPVGPAMNADATSLRLNVYCQPIDSSFRFIRIDTLILPRYIFEGDTPLHITESVRVSDYDFTEGQGGSIEIHSYSDIIVDENAIVSASETIRITSDDCVALNVDCKKVAVRKQQRKVFINDIEDDSNYTVGAAGGDIRLCSVRKVHNKGVLYSGASDGGQYRGGSIVIESTSVVNTGSIESSVGGAVEINCSQIKNCGVIYPQPLITIGQDNAWSRNESEKKWSTFEKVIPMEIYDFSGCLNDDYHPRNLLVEDGAKGTCYVSRSSPAPKPVSCGESWIILKNNTSTLMKPSSIHLRNSGCNESVKSIAFYSGNDDGKWIKLCDDVRDIPKEKDVIQRIELSSTVSDEQCLSQKGDMILVHFLENHDRLDRVFCRSLRFFGHPLCSHHRSSQESWRTTIEYLRSIPNRIEDRDAFLGEIGVRVNADWIQSLMDYKHLCAKTEYDDKRIIDRLSDELHLEIFKIFEIINGNIVVDDALRLLLNQKVVKERSSNDDSKEGADVDDDIVSKYVFSVTLGDMDPEEKPNFSFERLSHFAVPVKAALSAKAASLSVHMHCKPLDDSFGFIRVNTLILPKYIFEGDSPLNISESMSAPAYDSNLDFGGGIEIQCESNIVIEGTAKVSASETLMITKEDCVALNDQSKLVAVRMEQKKRLIAAEATNIQFTEGAAGGNIRLCTKGNMQNNGVICSESSGGRQYRGGCIHIEVNSLVNTGIIGSSVGGIVELHCNQITNCGLIYPAPLMTIGMESESMKMAQEKKWSTFEKVIPMEIYDYSGCLNGDYHPRNLLVEDGAKGTCYVSRSSPAPKPVSCGESWIILKNNTSTLMKPSSIHLRNSGCNESVKSIAFYSGNDDGKWIKLCDDVRNIPKEKDAVQKIELSLTTSSEKSVPKRDDLILVHFLENRDKKDRVFCRSLRFFGYTLCS